MASPLRAPSPTARKSISYFISHPCVYRPLDPSRGFIAVALGADLAAKKIQEVVVNFCESQNVAWGHELQSQAWNRDKKEAPYRAMRCEALSSTTRCQA